MLHQNPNLDRSARTSCFLEDRDEQPRALMSSLFLGRTLDAAGEDPVPTTYGQSLNRSPDKIEEHAEDLASSEFQVVFIVLPTP